VTATTDRDGFGPARRDFVEATAATPRDGDSPGRAGTTAPGARADPGGPERDALERLDRINDIIRGIDQALVQASTRAEIESVVCDRLATGGPYELAWVGDVDQVTGEIRARVRRRREGSLDDLTVGESADEESDHLAARAVERREPQFADDVLSEEDCGSWRREALNRGYHAAIALPRWCTRTPATASSPSTAGKPGVFDELERSVLGELSRTIAHAINAVESKKALVSEEVTVLEFAVDDDAPRW